ncbi:hypothetical protein HYX18_01345 [Candidatus Woesearchaeota archaeon]|nr:hypothetical protein [Candidatus Woesearchaeota archaeon]
MSEIISLKMEFERRYGINKAYLTMMGKRQELNLPSNFDYFVIDATRPTDLGESEFYEIRLTRNGHAEPIAVIIAKKYTGQRFDVFDRKVSELNGLKTEAKNPVEQDAIFLPYFGDITVYDHLPQHDLLLMERWGDSEGNYSLEDRLTRLHRLYIGGDQYQKKGITNRVKGDLAGVIDLAREHFVKATQDFNIANEEQKQATVFYDQNGNPRMNTPSISFFVDRINKYLEEIFEISYYRARRLIDKATQLPVTDSVEVSRMNTRRNELFERLGDKYENEIAALAGALAFKNRGIVHFDTRTPNVLVRDHNMGFCDYEKISLATGAIDPAIIVNDPIVRGFSIPLNERIELLERASLDKETIIDAMVWSILRLSGAQAMLQIFHPTKYMLLLQRSQLYDNGRIISHCLKDLDILLEGSRKYPTIREAIKSMQEVNSDWKRRTSPIAKQRIIERITEERRPGYPKLPNGEKNKVPA